MSDAFNYLYYIFDKFVDFVFNDMEIAQNVSVGWIAISIILFSIMIRSILNIPRGISFNRNRGGENE